MCKIIAIALSLFLCPFDRENNEINLTFTGDVVLVRGVADELSLHGDSTLITSINALSIKSPLVINYEGTFTDAQQSKIDTFNFMAEKRLATVLRAAGVTHASVANNHSFDDGLKGFNSTVAVLEQNNIIPLGAKCTPVIYANNKYKCAILSASLVNNNDSLCISSIRSLKDAVKYFNSSNPKIPLIVYIHWGLEYQPKPELWQNTLSEELVQLGVDAIIGHHPHVVQSIEFVQGVPIIYSAGNFIADAYLPLTDESIIITLSITDKVEKTRLIPISLDNYFPRLPDDIKQIYIARNALTYSDGVGLIKSADSWELRPIKDIDFTECAEVWLLGKNQTVAVIRRLDSGTKVLSLLLSEGFSNAISLIGELSAAEIADIDNNGTDDIIVELRKSVKYDPENKKRINIFSYHNGNLQPLWLGTKFIYDLISFDIVNSNGRNYLSTVESDSLGNLYDATYEWDNFGFALDAIEPMNN